MNRYEVTSSITGAVYMLEAVLAISAKAQAARLDGAVREDGFVGMETMEKYAARLLEAPKE